MRLPEMRGAHGQRAAHMHARVLGQTVPGTV